MELSDKTSRQLFAAFKANPTRKRLGFGRMPALINIDLQKAYTCVEEFATAYETDPRQLEYVNGLAEEFRSRGFPVVWTLSHCLLAASSMGSHLPATSDRILTKDLSVSLPGRL